MSLRLVVAAPFKRAGTGELSEQEFVVALSLHRDWFTPEQAKRVIEVATAEGLLERDEDEVAPTFDPATVTIPRSFEPEEDVLATQSTFEAMLDRIVDDGIEKRTAVGDINRLQRKCNVSIEAAAALYATRHGIDVQAEVARAANELEI